MIEEISLRNVGNEQIYDSYMGILRISPTDLDGTYVDSMSLPLTNPKLQDGKDRQIILSDSDGTKLGAYWIVKVRETDVIDTTGRSVKQNVVNIVTKTDSNLFVSKDFHVRSTLIVNRDNQDDKISPLQIYHESPNYVNAYDVLAYPVDSPHDGSYFNDKNKLKLINYQKSQDVHTQLKESLFKQSKEWYDKNIPAVDRVKIGDKFIYTQNINYEQIPIVYTKDYVLGHYTGHTARVTDDIKTKFITNSIGPDRLINDQSILTKLSFIQIDKLVWDIVHEAAQGYIRHTEGRYSMMGIGENESISERLFGQINPPSTSSPLLGMGVSPGIIINHAMPFHRFMFHVLRQQLRNREDENNSNKNLAQKYKDYLSQNKITPIAKQDPGFVNQLTKEFVLCDGRELTYANYPSVNTDSTNMFSHNDKGIVNRNGDGLPQAASTKPAIYSAISASFNGKVQVPSLLAVEQQSPRYIRGLNWRSTLGTEAPVNLNEGITTGIYSENQIEHEIIKGSTYGLTKKNFMNAGLYRMNVDWKANKIRHKHRCFYNSKDYNREQKKGNNFGPDLIRNVKIPYRWHGKIKYKYQTMITPVAWNSLAAYDEIVDKDELMKYSFTKHKVSGSSHITNTWGYHTPVPSAGMWAWKIDKDGTVHNDTVVSNYVIQNVNETVISSNATTRKDQLELINYSEGSAPIANKGGCHAKGLGTYSYIYCSRRKKNGHHNRLRDGCSPDIGGYFLQRAIEGDLEVPRCITSLPHPNIEQEKTTHVDPLKVTMGGVTITPDTSLSFPPTVILLPLFKI